jgi:hypothetical protein
MVTLVDHLANYLLLVSEPHLRGCPYQHSDNHDHITVWASIHYVDRRLYARVSATTSYLFT